MSDDLDGDFMDEMPIPADRSPTGLEDLGPVEALQARVTALEALVDMLVERDIQRSKGSAERYVNSECAALFGRIMHSEAISDDISVKEVAEMIAGNVIERHGREKQAREAN